MQSPVLQRAVTAFTTSLVASGTIGAATRSRRFVIMELIMRLCESSLTLRNNEIALGVSFMGTKMHLGPLSVCGAKFDLTTFRQVAIKWLNILVYLD